MSSTSKNLSGLLKRFARTESGAAIVEFAIVLPLMLVTFGLIAEGGRIFWSYQDAITGVRDTARHIGRIAPVDLCSASPSASISDFEAFATAELASLSSDQFELDLDDLSIECVGAAGDYRVSPAPVAVLTASLTITDLPFAPLFQLVGVTAATEIATTVTDRSRVFGP